MGRARGFTGAVSVNGFDSAVGRRRGSGADAEAPAATPVPTARRSAQAVIDAVGASYYHDQPLEDDTLADACDLLNGDNLSTGAHEGLRYVLACSAVVDAHNRHRQPLSDLFQTVCPGRPLVDVDAIRTEKAPAIINELDTMSRAEAVTPELVRKRGNQAVFHANADHLADALLTPTRQRNTMWENLPGYEGLRAAHADRPIGPDRELAKLADPDRLRVALSDWMAEGFDHQTLADRLHTAF